MIRWKDTALIPYIYCRDRGDATTWLSKDAYLKICYKAMKSKLLKISKFNYLYYITSHPYRRDGMCLSALSMKYEV